MRNNVIRIAAGVIIVIALMYMIGTQNWAFLPSASASLAIAGVIPGLLIIFLGFGSVAEVKGSPAVIGSMAFVGIGFALLVSELDAVGVLVAGSFGTWTVFNVQFMCILGGLLIGAFMYYRR